MFKAVKKIQRGQIWMVNEASEITQAKLDARSREICGSHPYLIISNNDLLVDDSIHVVQGVPITSKVEKRNPSDIIFENAYGSLNRLIPSQIQCVDKRDFVKYMFEFPEETMREMDSIIMGLLGVTPIHQIETTLQDNTEDDTECDVYVDPEVSDETVDAIEVVDEVSEDGTSINIEIPETPMKRRNVKWTDGQYMNLLKDKLTMSNAELADKYDMDKPAMAKRVYYARTRMAKRRKGLIISTSKYDWSKNMNIEFVVDYDLFGIDEVSTMYNIERSVVKAKYNYIMKHLND